MALAPSRNRSHTRLAKIFFLTFAALAPTALRAQSASAGRVVLVLPFENRSGNATLNWIGDSFPDTLDRRLNSAGFLTISHDDRVFALTHLGLPGDFRPSRATTIRIAQQVDANYVVIGSFTLANGEIAIQSQTLSIDKLTLSPPITDGAPLERLYDAENSIAWKVARAIDPSLNVAEQTFLGAGERAVPLPAFEDYIRGINAPTSAEAVQRLRTAVAAAPNYTAAMLALGKQQYLARDYASAATTLAKVPPSDPQALEANFYLGLARFNAANYAGAYTAFEFVATRLPLPEVVNNQGVALSRQGKDAVALFTAHSVPTRTVEGDDPDPYAVETKHTAELVAGKTGVATWHFAFQSQGVAGGPWIGPTVEETLTKLKEEGHTAVVIQPIGFVCDHVEVLYDIDIAFQQTARELGLQLIRAESLNDSPLLTEALVTLAN